MSEIRSLFDPRSEERTTPSPAVARRLALGHTALAADMYWIRAIQYYGGTKRRLEGEFPALAPPRALAADPGVDFPSLYPLLDLTTTLAVIPSITELGRVRVGFDTTLEWEIYDDLYWRLTFFDDFDTDARSDDAESDQAENDYGITTSIGWTW